MTQLSIQVSREFHNWLIKKAEEKDISSVEEYAQVLLEQVAEGLESATGEKSDEELIQERLRELGYI